MNEISIIPTFGDKGLNVETIQIKLIELGFRLGNIRPLAKFTLS